MFDTSVERGKSYCNPLSIVGGGDSIFKVVAEALGGRKGDNRARRKGNGGRGGKEKWETLFFPLSFLPLNPSLTRSFPPKFLMPPNIPCNFSQNNARTALRLGKKY